MRSLKSFGKRSAAPGQTWEIHTCLARINRFDVLGRARTDHEARYRRGKRLLRLSQCPADLRMIS